MASTQLLKRRMGSVKNTKQITKAMEMVAASKMRRAQESAYRSRDYKNVAHQILTRLRELTDVNKHPLYQQRAIKTRLHIVITSDRGLAGAYNSNVLKLFTKELHDDEQATITSQAIVIGKQAARFVTRLEHCETLAAYEEFPEHPTANDIRPILNTVTKLYEDKAVDAVDIIFTDYKSSISQEVKSERIIASCFSASRARATI